MRGALCHVSVARAAAAASAAEESPAAYGDRKPAKPDTDLISYWTSLSEPLQRLAAAAAAGTAPAAEDATAARAAAREAAHAEASLACHKACAGPLESLLSAAPPRALARALRSLQPYAAFVAASRHGSHVLQTALTSAHAVLAGTAPWNGPPEATGADEENDASAGDEYEAAANADDGHDWTSEGGVHRALTRELLAWAQLLLARMPSLLFDASGTHVLRALWCALAGLDPRAHAHSHARGCREGDAYGGGGRRSPGAAAVGASSLSLPSPAALRLASQRTYANVGRRCAAQLQAGLIAAVQSVGEADFAGSAACAGEETIAGVRPPSPLAEDGAWRPLANDDDDEALRVALLAGTTGGEPAASARTDTSAASDAPPLLRLRAPAYACADDSNVVAMACDTVASPTLQMLLKAAVAAFAPAGTVRYLCRRLTGLPLLTVPPSTADGSLAVALSEASGAADLLHTLSSKISGFKRTREIEQPAAVAAAEANSTSGGSAMTMLLESMTTHTTGARLVEALVAYGDEQLQAELWSAFFKPHLDECLAHEAANYAIQRLLTSCASPALAVEVVSAVLDAAGPSLGLLTGAARRDGVILHLVAACAGAAAVGHGGVAVAGAAAGAATGAVKRAPPPPHALVPAYSGAPAPMPAHLQERLARALFAAAGSPPPGALADAHVARWWLDIAGYRSACAAGAQPLPMLALVPGSGPLSLPLSPLAPSGTRVLAAVLRLSAPAARRPFLDMLAALPGLDLACLAADALASRHILEPIFRSSCEVGNGSDAAARKRLLNSLRGWWPRVAASRFGCWLVTRVLAEGVDSPQRRASIAQELAAADVALGATIAGRTVLRIARIEQFRKNSASWEAAWARAGDRSAQLADVVREADAAVAAAAAVGASFGGKNDAGLKKPGMQPVSGRAFAPTALHSPATLSQTLSSRVTATTATLPPPAKRRQDITSAAGNAAVARAAAGTDLRLTVSRFGRGSR